MSYSYERLERSSRRPSRRGTYTYWLPLAATITVATIGVVAWIWSERQESEEDEDGPQGDGTYPRPPYGQQGPSTGPPSYAGDLRPGEAAYGTIPAGGMPPQHRPEESQSYIARMSGALQRAPSPQQVIGGASRSVAAGVAAAGAAAGAVIGSALSSIREEDKNAYGDHKTWSEEAESRKNSTAPPPLTPSASGQQIQMRESGNMGSMPTSRSTGNGKRKTVAIVVSAEAVDEDFEGGDSTFHQHASIISHLPRNTDFSKVRLFVLIYAPGLKEHPLDASRQQPPSLGSSYSNIGQEQAQSPDRPSTETASPTFKAVYAEALALVEKDTMVIPFTTPTGHVHILRHLGPDLVYLQESLAGDNGEVITHLQTWLRQDVILVVGAEGGHGGLADSESEAEAAPEKQQWWKQEERVGLGRGVVVVEGLRVGDDWARRIEHRG